MVAVVVVVVAAVVVVVVVAVVVLSPPPLGNDTRSKPSQKAHPFDALFAVLS